MFRFISKTVIVVSITMLLLSLTHILSSKLYNDICVPFTLLSVFTTPFMSQSFHCVSLRYITELTASNMNTLLLTIGTTIVSYIPDMKKIT